MPEVIADTTCLIILTKIQELSILQKLYGRVSTTPDVVKEFGEPLPDRVIIKTPIDLQKQLELEQQVDKGEASAITLALRHPRALSFWTIGKGVLWQNI